MKLIMCFLFFWTSAQLTIAEQDVPYFQKIGMEEGLSHRKVNCILQDRRGFMWFGTEDGLNRYDGHYFTHFRHIPGDPETISGNIITDLYEDREGILWIATRDGGMSRYDYRLSPERQFKQYRHNLHDPQSIPENGISKIVEDNRGYLWLGTSGNFAIRFDKRSSKFDTPVARGTMSILSLAMGEGDTLWVGRAGGGLLKINTKNLSYQTDPRYQDLYTPMPHVSIPALFRDSQNNFWVGSWDKLVYRLATGKKETALNPFKSSTGSAPDDVVDFAQDQHRNIWMAGKNSGVAVYDSGADRFVHLRHDPQKDGSIGDDHVNDIYIDRNNVVWIATSNGVSMFNPLFSPFTKNMLPDYLSDVRIYDFFKDSSGSLWVGTSEGIFIKHKGKKEFEHRVVIYEGQKLAITKFFKDQDGRFYIGTDYTLFVYDMASNKASPLAGTSQDPVMKKLINSRIVSIVRDTIAGHPALLVSPYGHFITYYDFTDKRWVSRSDTVRKILKKYNIKDNLVRKLYQDRRNQLWLATYKAGLGKWKTGNGPVQYFANDTQNKYSLTSNDVFDIQQEASGNFWISTYGGGVNFFEPKKGKFTHLAVSSNLTEGMQLDSLNNLWMLCNGHVHKYDKSTQVYSCYDLPALQQTGGLSGYFYKDDDGVLYAAGQNYYINFQPADIAHIDQAPKIYFTDFEIMGKSYSHYLSKKKIELNYQQNIFSIVYAAPEYTGENLQYAYLMEGVDTEWVTAGKRNVAHYTNLKGGTYKFRVRATNWKGSYGNSFSELTIVIQPPFWLTIWFWSLMALVLAGITYLLYRYRVNTFLKQQAVRNGIAQDLHDQVGATLSSISVYSEVARRYADQSKAQALTDVLNTINYTANDMVTEMADIVWAINPSHDHLGSVLARIRRYAQPLCDVKEINFRFDYDKKISGINVGMKSRKNIFLILKESINNAIKHAECSNLVVYVLLYNNVMELVIKDDGLGFKQNRISGPYGEGNGLKNIKSRADELNASLVIESKQDVGTTMKVIFKVNHNI